MEVYSAVLPTIAVILYLLYRYFTENYNYWKDRNVVYDPPKLIFGSALDYLLRRKHPILVYADIYNKYPNESLVGIYEMHTPSLVIRDPEIIKQVLISDFGNFRDRGNLTNEKNEPLSLHLFNLRAERWKPTRQKLTPAFTTGKLKNMIPLMLEVGEEFSKYIEGIIKDETETECRELMAKFTTDVIGSVGFGIKMNSMFDVDAPFRRIGRLAFQNGPQKSLRRLFKGIFPKIFDLLNMRIHEKEIETFFIKSIQETIKERQRSGLVRNDFIDMILALKDKDDSMKPSDDQSSEKSIVVDDYFIMAQAFVYFAGGFETTSTMMSFLLHELALHQDIQQKVHEEIRSVLKANDRKLDYETLSKLPYLDMVINETLRKYHIGALLRVCTTPYTFPDTKITIDKDVKIIIPSYAIQNDPKYFPNPEEFKPERFAPEAKNDIKPMTYLPFGDGPRNCIGLRLARIQVVVGLVTLLKDYRVEPCSKTTSKFEYDVASTVLSNKHGIWLSIKKRN